MQRAILGYLSIALLIGYVAITFFGPEGDSWQTLAGAMLRVALVFGAVWLAIPNFTILFARIPPWLIAATFVGLVIVIWKPQSFLIVGPILILMWILGPNWLQRRRRE